MNKQFKKTESYLGKFQKKPEKKFTNDLKDCLLKQYPSFQSEKKVFWQFNFFNPTNMKYKLAGTSLIITLLLSGSLIWHYNSKQSNNNTISLSDSFLNTAYASYEKMINQNFSQKIQLNSGKDFEDYLALFDDPQNEDLGTALREYGRPAYVFNLISSPNIELFYENQKPIVKIHNNNKVKHFEYLPEKGITETTSESWKELDSNINFNRENTILSLIKSLKNDPKISIVSDNNQEIIFSRPASNINLPTKDIVNEEYHFDKSMNTLLERSEVTIRNNKKYILRTETFEKQTSDNKNFWFFENDNLISFSAEQYYYAGGANGLQYFASFNYDKKAEKLLTLKDIFTNTEAGLKILSTYSREALPKLEQISEMYAADMLEAGTEPKLENFSEFNFVGNDNNQITGINLHFSEYQVAPGAAGSVNLTVPLDVIKAVLK